MSSSVFWDATFSSNCTGPQTKLWNERPPIVLLMFGQKQPNGSISTDDSWNGIPFSPRTSRLFLSWTLNHFTNFWTTNLSDWNCLRQCRFWEQAEDCRTLSSRFFGEVVNPSQLLDSRFMRRER